MKNNKFFYNIRKASDGLLHAQGYKSIKKDDYLGEFVYHYQEKPDIQYLNQMDIEKREEDVDIEGWNPIWGYKPEKNEIFYTFHIFPEIKNVQGEQLVIPVLDEDIELKESN